MFKLLAKGNKGKEILESDIPGQSRWKSSNLVSLIPKTEKFKQIKSVNYLFISNNKILYCFEQKEDKSAYTYIEYFRIEIDDNIINYHILDDFRIVIIGREKKCIYLYEQQKLLNSM